MKRIEQKLIAMRLATDNHIRELESKGKAGLRYTAMMPNIPFFVLAILCDIAWIIQIVFGIRCIMNNGITGPISILILISLLGVGIGVVYLIYLNRINEKSIATRFQKNASFGTLTYAGLIGAVAAVIGIHMHDGANPDLVWLFIGGIFNFLTGLPVLLSFKKGIIYDVH